MDRYVLAKRIAETHNAVLRDWSDWSRVLYFNEEGERVDHAGPGVLEFPSAFRPVNERQVSAWLRGHGM